MHKQIYRHRAGDRQHRGIDSDGVPPIKCLRFDVVAPKIQESEINIWFEAVRASNKDDVALHLQTHDRVLKGHRSSAVSRTTGGLVEYYKREAA